MVDTNPVPIRSIYIYILAMPVYVYEHHTQYIYIYTEWECETPVGLIQATLNVMQQLQTVDWHANCWFGSTFTSLHCIVKRFNTHMWYALSYVCYCWYMSHKHLPPTLHPLHPLRGDLTTDACSFARHTHTHTCLVQRIWLFNRVREMHPGV